MLMSPYSYDGEKHRLIRASRNIVTIFHQSKTNVSCALNDLVTGFVFQLCFKDKYWNLILT